MSILPQRRGAVQGGGGSQRPKNLSKYMKLDWNFQRGGGGGAGGGGGCLRENPLLWGRYG